MGSTAWSAAGLLATLIWLSYAEISTMYDRTGGPPVYVREAMSKMAGCSVGWIVWVTCLVVWAVLSNGLRICGIAVVTGGDL